MPYQHIKSRIFSAVNGSMNSLMSELKVSKSFCYLHVKNTENITQVNGYPPIYGWTNCNTDGTFLKQGNLSACVGVWRNSNVENMGCFSSPLQVGNTFEVVGLK